MARVLETGQISEIWRFPVKSMGGERLEQAQVTSTGMEGDRAFALIETETGKVVSAKSVKHFPGILGFQAALRGHGDKPHVTVTFPDGTKADNMAGDLDRLLSQHFGRAVMVSGRAPDDYTIDMLHLASDGVLTETSGEFADQKLGSALWEGDESPVAPGTFFDVYPMSVMTTSTLRRLQALAPSSQIDVRRFRMNLIAETDADGFIENDWVGQTLAIGDELRLRVMAPDNRCVMPTLAQGDLPRDIGVMNTLIQHNRIEVEPGAFLPCAGVYAVVERPGRVRVGDAVQVEA